MYIYKKNKHDIKIFMKYIYTLSMNFALFFSFTLISDWFWFVWVELYFFMGLVLELIECFNLEFIKNVINI